uniref:Uncharacterized protein n=1 Tax=Ceratitis capitata TaxID=7213 RepID=W8BPI4_CERCA
MGHVIFSHFRKQKVTQQRYAACPIDREDVESLAFEKILPDDLFGRYAAPKGHFLIIERLLEYLTVTSVGPQAVVLLFNRALHWEMSFIVYDDIEPKLNISIMLVVSVLVDARNMKI